jgi:hypothetical protein
MSWLETIIRTIFDWILEIPPDLLGRKVEGWLDQAANRRRRKKKSGHRKVYKNRKPARAFK